MASVFLSYDRDDSDRARHFARALEKDGHQVWWDLHVRGGAQFSKVIEEALKAADAVVVLWSANSIESAWVRDEAAAGRDTGRLVPVTIDGTEPPLGFRQFQTINLSRWNGRRASPELRTLLADVESTTSSADAPPSPRPSEAAHAQSPRAAQRRNAVLLACAAFLLLLLVGGFYWKFGANDAGPPTVRVIAADNSPLSQSVAHNVLVNLGSVAGNAARNFRFLDESSRARPDFRLTVSGIQQGGGTQATVALASPREEGILWSKQIQEPANERSSLEKAAAYAAMGAISCATDDNNGESRRLSATDFRAYLNACISRDEADDLQSLAATFRKATEAAPHMAAAWANLLSVEADNLRFSKVSDQPTDQLESALRRDIAAARRISGDLPEATIAEVSLQPPRAFQTSISLMDKAIAAHPDNVDLLTERAIQLSMVGRMAEALTDAERATELKPYSAALRANYIVALASSGGVAKAWADLADAKKLWPDSGQIAATDTNINLRYGDFEKSWRAAGYPVDGGILGYFKILRQPTDANIDAWVNLAKTHKMLRPHRSFILQALGPLNRVDQLYEFLQQWPMEQDLQGQTYILFRPWMAKVRRDPRFMRLSQRLGLLQYWEKSGKWPDFCAEPDMPYDCKTEAAKLAS